MEDRLTGVAVATFVGADTSIISSSSLRARREEVPSFLVMMDCVCVSQRVRAESLSYRFALLSGRFRGLRGSSDLLIELGALVKQLQSTEAVDGFTKLQDLLVKILEVLLRRYVNPNIVRLLE